jgi:hypothetical protein
MRPQKDVRGHFASLWVPSGATIIPTTVTTQRKSYARQKEAAKKAQVLAELRELTGSQDYATVSTPIDNVQRRWRSVRNHGPDG